MTRAPSRPERAASAIVEIGGGQQCLALVFGCCVLGGCVDQRCYEQADCPRPKICGSTGLCVYECLVRSDCAGGFTCVDRVCRPSSTGPISCPADMVAVADAFCIDRHEASRRDATAVIAGHDGTQARSAAGVIPWQVDSNEQAEQACQAAGKRLCSPVEWQYACAGPDRTVYAYGNDYQPRACNGIDTYGRSNFRLMPTGSFPGCTNEWGAFDLNGNVWEHVAGGNDQTIRGGAYNCNDSATYQRCDYVPRSWTPSARGFRCCLTPVTMPDAGLVDARPVDADAVTEGGCIDDDSGTPTDGADRDTRDSAYSDANSADASREDGGTGCPSEMAVVGTYCIDIYEASRADATEMAAGSSTIASVRRGVIPWYSVNLAQARAGCETMGKRLCRLDEWFNACQGPDRTVYSYGNTYDPLICNGIDTFCNCSAAACASLAVCPYPHCYNQTSMTESGGPCGAYFHVMPTGSFASCTNRHGVFDINGNVWEIVDATDSYEHFRGGAFNCSDSEWLHRCDHDGTWGPSARGFRCCKDRRP